MWRLLNLRALNFATAATVFLAVIIVIGSRNLQNFDTQWCLIYSGRSSPFSVAWWR